MTPDELVRTYKSREEFNPFAHAADVREHPEMYVSMQEIAEDVAALMMIRKAATLDALKLAFQAPAKKAKAVGDAELLKLFTEAAANRKMQLEAQ